MRRLARLTPGTALGIAAVVLAVSGSAFAAKQYVVTSKGQIAPSVRKALKGKAGKTGPIGRQGAKGAEGPRGPEGLRGPEGPRGPEGSQGAPGVVSTQTSFADGPSTIPENWENAVVVLGPVPSPGKYLGIAKFSITPDGPGEINCSLYSQQNSIGGYDVSSIQGDDIEQTVTLTYPGNFAAPLSSGFAGFIVFCSTPAGTTASFKHAKVNLIRSDDVTLLAN